MSTIYIHWPFCLSKCSYCDFNSYKISKNIDYEHFTDLYIKILNLYVSEGFYQKNNDIITSVYFGGGTPSLMHSEHIEKILNFIYKTFKISDNLEITLEANPKTIDKNKAKFLKSIGINRISIGVQSIDDRYLKLLGRIHSSKDAINSVNDMLEIFENVSFDMIYNRPYQTLEEWEDELNEALQIMKTPHISLYELIVEKDTAIYNQIKDKIIPDPISDDRFLDRTYQITRDYGFEMYEVSNFAKKGFEGRHNISYWKYEEYFAVGPGSHARVIKDNQKFAIEQIKNINNWIDWAENPIFQKYPLSELEIFEEKLIMGLRSKFGINPDNLSHNLKKILNFDDKISNLLKNSYIILNDRGDIITTYEGLKRLNLVIDYILR